jgi:hypothetical protein
MGSIRKFKTGGGVKDYTQLGLLIPQPKLSVYACIRLSSFSSRGWHDNQLPRGRSLKPQISISLTELVKLLIG